MVVCSATPAKKEDLLVKHPNFTKWHRNLESDLKSALNLCFGMRKGEKILFPQIQKFTFRNRRCRVQALGTPAKRKYKEG
jgi:hypothetical protein